MVEVRLIENSKLTIIRNIALQFISASMCL